mmetsp:Transcript_12441/g.18827  ORF Transcript_12441/g.18827 Transcript_12441/m.18827 type:complete len:209 (+) Transcript_12441:44-670(+)
MEKSASSSFRTNSPLVASGSGQRPAGEQNDDRHLLSRVLFHIHRAGFPQCPALFKVAALWFSLFFTRGPLWPRPLEGAWPGPCAPRCRRRRTARRMSRPRALGSPRPRTNRRRRRRPQGSSGQEQIPLFPGLLGLSACWRVRPPLRPGPSPRPRQPSWPPPPPTAPPTAPPIRLRGLWGASQRGLSPSPPFVAGLVSSGRKRPFASGP